LSLGELEIADLIASGLTNSEIAQRLVISASTVESHVDHIKTKLGLARRARIVTWARDRRSADSNTRLGIRETTDDDQLPPGSELPMQRPASGP
jgi:DNA-binding CsgD family transcriptional regulator